MVASEKGHQAVVDTLLAHGADVNLKGVRTVVGRWYMYMIVWMQWS